MSTNFRYSYANVKFKHTGFSRRIRQWMSGLQLLRSALFILKFKLKYRLIQSFRTILKKAVWEIIWSRFFNSLPFPSYNFFHRFP